MIGSSLVKALYKGTYKKLSRVLWKWPTGQWQWGCRPILTVCPAFSIVRLSALGPSCSVPHSHTHWRNVLPFPELGNGLADLFYNGCFGWGPWPLCYVYDLLSQWIYLAWWPLSAILWIKSSFAPRESNRRLYCQSSFPNKSIGDSSCMLSYSREPCESQLVVIHRLQVILGENLLKLLLDVPEISGEWMWAFWKTVILKDIVMFLVNFVALFVYT